MDRQHPPAAARTNQVAHGIDHLAEIYFSRSPPATRLGHQRRNLLPLLVFEVRRIALDLLGDLGHPATALLCPHPELESEIQPRRNPPSPFSKRSLSSETGGGPFPERNPTRPLGKSRASTLPCNCRGGIGAQFPMYNLVAWWAR